MKSSLLSTRLQRISQTHRTYPIKQDLFCLIQYSKLAFTGNNVINSLLFGRAASLAHGVPVKHSWGIWVKKRLPRIIENKPSETRTVCIILNELYRQRKYRSWTNAPCVEWPFSEMHCFEMDCLFDVIKAAASVPIVNYETCVKINAFMCFLVLALLYFMSHLLFWCTCNKWFDLK